MAITKYIVDEMKGVIALRSETDRGTEFHVALDLEKGGEQEEDMILPDWEMLVVDDDEQLCRGAVACLGEIGVKAEWATGGKVAVEMTVKRHNDGRDYHVVLLDWKMPGMDGIQTAREIRRHVGGDVPIILISAYDWSEIEAEARAAGINGFISKPLFKSTLFHGLKCFTGPHAVEYEPQKETATDYTG
jgi:CheY-like chemotaxis protein